MQLFNVCSQSSSVVEPEMTATAVVQSAPTQQSGPHDRVIVELGQSAPSQSLDLGCIVESREVCSLSPSAVEREISDAAVELNAPKQKTGSQRPSHEPDLGCIVESQGVCSLSPVAVDREVSDAAVAQNFKAVLQPQESVEAQRSDLCRIEDCVVVQVSDVAWTDQSWTSCESAKPQANQNVPERRSESARLDEKVKIQTLDHTLLLGAERTLFAGQQMGFNVILVGMGLMMTSVDNKAPEVCGILTMICGVIFIANSWFVHMWRLRCIQMQKPASFGLSASWTLAVGLLVVLSVSLELVYARVYPYLLRTKLIDFAAEPV